MFPLDSLFLDKLSYEMPINQKISFQSHTSQNKEKKITGFLDFFEHLMKFYSMLLEMGGWLGLTYCLKRQWIGPEI